ncbi:hypothetical protein ABZ714_13075 [Streptomyces sp. NPDC006798]|uniref:hypothetical protein n=1 Tax=Streptomyces sp. NPDC006798 TaxID=3155462 RepID=UPI0033DA970A
MIRTVQFTVAYSGSVEIEQQIDVPERFLTDDGELHGDCELRFDAWMNSHKRKWRDHVDLSNVQADLEADDIEVLTRPVLSDNTLKETQA